MKITYSKVKKISEYRHKYKTEPDFQRAFFVLELDFKEDTAYLRADWNAELGNAVPWSVYYGYEKRFYFPPTLPKPEVNRLAGVLMPLFEQYAAEAVEKFDGNNYRVIENDNMKYLELKIESIIDTFNL